MAKPVTTVIHVPPTPEEVEEGRLAEIRRQAASDAEGVKEALQLLQAMHDRGVLELFLALFERGDQVLQIVVDQLAKPGAIHGLRSIITLLQALAAVDVQALTKLTEALAAGAKAASEVKAMDEPVNVFQLLAQLKDPDVSAAIGSGMAFLKAVGRALRNADEVSPTESDTSALRGD
jgi:uncharacterized protein YjgD (DUF1641 family)